MLSSWTSVVELTRRVLPSDLSTFVRISHYLPSPHSLSLFLPFLPPSLCNTIRSPLPSLEHYLRYSSFPHCRVRVLCIRVTLHTRIYTCMHVYAHHITRAISPERISITRAPHAGLETSECSSAAANAHVCTGATLAPIGTSREVQVLSLASSVCVRAYIRVRIARIPTIELSSPV